MGVADCARETPALLNIRCRLDTVAAVQILEVTQATIQSAIANLVSSQEWGNPREYDITVTRKGSKLDTEYTVQPSPHKTLSEDIKREFESKKLKPQCALRRWRPVCRFTDCRGASG